MHKKEITAKIAKKTELDDLSAKKVLNIVLSEIMGSLRKGQPVTLTGFGKFVIRKKKKRTMTNILDGKRITVPAHKAVIFEVGKPLRRLVW